MKFCAVVTRPAQSLSHDGCAHSTMTSLNPASLPPIVTETSVVVDVTDAICVFMSVVVVAPPQATNTRLVFGRCCETRYG